MAEFVLDTSAIIAFVWNERGADEVARMIGGAAVSANIIAEVVTKLSDAGMTLSKISEVINSFNFDVYAVSLGDALAIGALRPLTKSAGLSLGDRSCLALAAKLGLPAITSDRDWLKIADAIGVEVRLIR